MPVFRISSEPRQIIILYIISNIYKGQTNSHHSCSIQKMIRVVKAVIYKKKNYLLQLRDNNLAISSPNTWGLFGGGVESYESHEDALIRELDEELNWKPKEIILFHTDIKLRTKWFSVLCHAQNSELTLSEGQAMKWFNSKEIFDLPNTPDIVNYIIKKHENILYR